MTQEHITNWTEDFARRISWFDRMPLYILQGVLRSHYKNLMNICTILLLCIVFLIRSQRLL